MNNPPILSLKKKTANTAIKEEKIPYFLWYSQFYHPKQLRLTDVECKKKAFAAVFLQCYGMPTYKKNIIWIVWKYAFKVRK